MSGRVEVRLSCCYLCKGLFLCGILFFETYDLSLFLGELDVQSSELLLVLEFLLVEYKGQRY